MIKLIVFMGEAGSGKDRMLNEILASDASLNRVVSYTTRPKRENEVEGRDYYYMSENDFFELTKIGSMYEYSLHHWWYGTGVNSYDENKINIAVLNPEGIRSLIDDSRFDITVYWVRADAKTRLLRQLNREDNPDCNEIIRRYGTDTADFAQINFDYIDLPNNNIEELREALWTVQQDIKMLKTAPPHSSLDISD